MLKLSYFATPVAAALTLSSSLSAFAAPAARTDTSKVITVCAFSGKDVETVQLFRETLITDLAKSGKFTLYDAKNLPIGAKMPGGYRIVGSCSEVDGRVILNIRTVNVQGQLISGAATSETGGHENAATMAHMSRNMIPRS